MRRKTIFLLAIVAAASRSWCAAAVPTAAELHVHEAFDAEAFAARRAAVETRLKAAIAEFDAALAADASVRGAWHDYLKWNDWAPAVVHGRSRPVKRMREISKRFYAAKPGLEHPLLVALRESLADSLDLDEALRAAGGDVAGEYRRRTALLDQALAADELDFAELESAVWWLAATGQAPRTLAQVRAQFAGPVIVGQVHRGKIEAKLDEFENRTQQERQSRQRVLGATVVGPTTIESHTVAELFNTAKEARLRVTTRGAVHAPHNRATSGRVVVSSSAASQFTAAAEVYWDGQRFVATEPQAAADMRSTITGIDAPRLIRRAAARRVQSGRASAEAEGESLIERDVEQAMHERLEVAVDKLNGKVQGFLNFLARTGTSAEQWKTSVRESSVQIGYLPPSPSGLGAVPHEPPELQDGEVIGLSFHDAAVESILRPQVAGAVWTDVNFSMLQRELTGSNGEEFMIGLDPGRWSVEWSWRTPVRIHFSDECVTVRFQFSRVEIDGASYDVPFEVVAKQEASPTPHGLELRTRGEATVAALDPQQPLPPHFQSFLERKFRGLFLPRYYLDGLQFPAGGTLDSLSGYRPVGVTLEPNWVHLRYSNQPAKATFVVHDESK